jgi:hypothetical protein
VIQLIVIGCPVAHRDWIIRHWADHAIAAAARARLEPWFVLAAHPDDPTPAVLREHLDGRYGLVVAPTGTPRVEDRRTWGPARYEHLVDARNQLLRTVRELQPHRFVSVDSDVLLHPDAITTMLGLLGDYDAAGSACFLSHPPRLNGDGTPGAPSWLRPNWQPDVTRRVDVLMAIKAMTPRAYAVDYRAHGQGEDAGWGIACREAGVSLGWTSRVVSKHVMQSHCTTHPAHVPGCVACAEPIGRLDPRCGY